MKSTLGRLSLAVFPFLFLLLAFVLPHTLALQENLAGIADWHKPLIGQPLLVPTPPVFVDTPSGRQILAITKKNVFASLDAGSGDITWRHLLEDGDPVVSFHVSPDTSSVLLLSGPSGSQARLFSLDTGHVLWERTLIQLENAHLTTPIYLGTDASFTQDGQSVVILCDGQRVIKLDTTSGDIQWSLDAPGAGSTMLFKQLYLTPTRVHILALTSSFASHTLTTLTLSLQTSIPQSDLTQIPSIVTLPTSSFLTSSSSPTSARVIWLEHGRIRSVYLSEDGQLGDTKDIMPGKGHTFVGIQDVGMRGQGWVLGRKENGGMVIIDVKSGGRVVKEFENSHDSGDKSASVYSASAKGGSVTFNRVYWSFTMGFSVSQTYTISENGLAISTGFTFPFNTSEHGVILHAGMSSIVSTSEMPNLLLTTSNGAIQLVQQDKKLWTREEALSEIVAVRFIQLGEPKVEEARHAMAEENFVGRSFRHVLELRHLPAYTLQFIHRLITGSYTPSVRTPPLQLDNLHRDQFGFQKLLIAGTRSGKLYALDSANGRTLWTRSLGLTSEKGAELVLDSMWVVRENSEVGGPILSVVAVREIEGIKKTVAFHVEALTGEVRGEKDEKTGLAKGKVIFGGVPSTVFPVPFENCGSKIRVLAIAKDDQLEIFPFCKKVAKDMLDISSDLYFTTQTTFPLSITGHSLSSPSSPNSTFSALALWTQTFSPSERLISLTPASSPVTASYGRPLGDKSTLYKYLNPHILLLVTQDDTEKRGRIKVIDSVSGKVVWGVEVPDCEGLEGVMSENWVVWGWKGKEGWRVGSAELYEDRSDESKVIDSPGVSSHSSYHRIRAITQTFIAPSEMRSMAITSSQYEVTSKELVYVNGRNQVASIPRRLLDPRRPKGKPTAADKEEMLIPYDPYIGSDPRRVVSHNYEVLGVKSLTSSPALVESTSLLFAHGLDLFFTRALTPSGTFDILSDSFNKAQILLTLAVLGGGIFVAKPAVTRKALKARWY